MPSIDTKTAQAVDDCLEAARLMVPAFNLDGVSLLLQQLHINTGRYSPGSTTGNHMHDGLQLEFVIEGRMSFVIGNRKMILEAGTGNLIPPNILHSWNCLEGGRMMGVLFQIAGRQRSAFIKWLDNVFSGGEYVCGAELSDQAAGILTQAAQAEPRLWRREQVAARVFLWLTRLLEQSMDLREWMTPALPGGHTQRSRERRICEAAFSFMRSNISNPLQVSDIANHVGISIRHLNRLFHRHHGESAGRTFLTLRLETAHRMLSREPEEPVKRVAYRCGFSSPAHFAYAFRKHYGCSPGKVRLSKQPVSTRYIATP